MFTNKECKNWLTSVCISMIDIIDKLKYKDEICQCLNHRSGTIETNTENKFEKSWHKDTKKIYLLHYFWKNLSP